MPISTSRFLSVAALALAFTTPAVADLNPSPASGAYRDHRPLEQARAELEQLRGELGYYQAAYTELSQGLERIETANRGNRDRPAKISIQRAIRAARSGAARYVQPWTDEQRGAAWRDEADWRQPPNWDPPVMAAPAPVAMTTADFGALTVQVERASFASEKLGLIQAAAAANNFTVAQVTQLMQLAAFDDTRIEIAVTCAPRVIDGQRWFEVYGALSFSASRDALRKRLGS